MRTDNRMDTRRRHDVSIDAESDVIRARRLRAQVLAGFFRALRRRVMIARRKPSGTNGKPGVRPARSPPTPAA
jgi:hypothetical protein